MRLNKETSVGNIPLNRSSLWRRPLTRSLTSEEKATVQISCTYQQLSCSKVLQFPKGRGHWGPCPGRVTWVIQSLKIFTCQVQFFTETQACNGFLKQQLSYIFTGFLYLFIYEDIWTLFSFHFFLINRY